ncbi:MAG TPA: signal peptidase II, partial [Thermodesulfovibrionales bacterium]|nr:signal peptidase II [Thermodesulfovibrionales bacterium]
LVVLLDQVRKFLARSFIGPFDTIRVFPFLHLVSVRNEGVAFGLFKGFGNIPFIAISLIAIIVVIVLLIRGRETRFGLALILGGAIGNMIDRITMGSVTDFVDVFAGRFHWPAFNVADSALTVGLVVMIAGSFIHPKQQESN